MFQRATALRSARRLGAAWALIALAACNSDAPTSSDPPDAERAVEVLAPQALVGGVQGSAYTTSLAATGGNGSFAWAVTSGELPPGLALSSTGTISGTPVAAGSWTFTLTVTSGSARATRTVTLVIELPAIVITTTAPMPSGTEGVPYTATLSATGGNGSYTWSADGTLPPGLTLAPATGVLSGVPTSAGTFSLTVQAASGTLRSSKLLTLVIDPPPVTIATASLASGRVGTAYSGALEARGGDGRYDWSIVEGALPPGLTLAAATGLLSGTPSTAGAFAFVVQARSGASSARRSLTLDIAPPPVAITTPSVLAPGVQGTSYGATLQAVGGTGSYTWSVTSGALPPGLSLNASTGVISGTPSSAGPFAFTVQVTSGGQSSSAPLTLTVAPAPVVVVTTSPLAPAVQGTSYGATLQAVGGTGGYTWSVTSGALPPGLSLNASTGVIGGTPNSVGSFTFTVQVTSGGQNASRSLVLEVTAPPVSIRSASSLPQGIVGTGYQATLAATGGTGNFAWSVTSGALPPGLALNGGAGVIAGTPTAGGTYAFTLQVTSGGQTASRSFTLVIVTMAQGLRWPVDGVAGRDWVINNYVDLDPTSGLRDYMGRTGGNAKTYNGHNGIDIDVPNFRWQDNGTAVLAAASGVVISVVDGNSDRNTSCVGMANVVIVQQDDGLRAIYAHFKRSSIIVTPNQRVAAGAVLGLVGSSGCSTAPHLHFELRDAQNRVVEPFQPDLWASAPPYSPPFSVMDVVLKVGAITNNAAAFAYVLEPAPNATTIPVNGTMFVGMTAAGGRVGDQLRLQVLRPNNSVYLETQFNFPTEYRHTSWYWNVLFNATGAWTVRFLVNGSVQWSGTITVTPSP